VQGVLYRHGFLGLARETVRKLLRKSGRGPVLLGRRRRNNPPKVRSFERANPNELWQTDIMSFMIKGQYRVYLIGFMDDHSRFIVGWGLYRFQTAANVQEVFRAAIEKHGMPKEVLSDNGRQYYTWRGKSQFTQMLLKLGIRHIRSRPYHPQTCGKIESFWRNLFQECLSQVPLASFEEAKEKVGTYIEYYNFKRPHQGINQVTPSDRYYGVASQVKQIVEANTARIEESPAPITDYTPPAYLVGNLGGKELRVVARAAEVTLQDREAVPAVESPTGGGSAGSGGCLDASGGEIVRPGSTACAVPEGVEADHGKRSERGLPEAAEAAQPAGAIGSDPVGSGEGSTGGSVVPPSGGIPGAVLPVDETGQDLGAGGSGNPEAGTQTRETHGAGCVEAPTDGGALKAPGAGSGIPAQGAELPRAGQPGVAADYPAASGPAGQVAGAAVERAG
jgi:transposase InsO family protein